MRLKLNGMCHGQYEESGPVSRGCTIMIQILKFATAFLSLKDGANFKYFARSVALVAVCALQEETRTFPTAVLWQFHSIELTTQYRGINTDTALFIWYSTKTNTRLTITNRQRTSIHLCQTMQWYTEWLQNCLAHEALHLGSEVWWTLYKLTRYPSLRLVTLQYMFALSYSAGFPNLLALVLHPFSCETAFDHKSMPLP